MDHNERWYQLRNQLYLDHFSRALPVLHHPDFDINFLELDYNESSLLHYFCSIGKIPGAFFLLIYGIDPNIKNNLGLKASDVAKAPYLADLLKNIESNKTK